MAAKAPKENLKITTKTLKQLLDTSNTPLMNDWNNSHDKFKKRLLDTSKLCLTNKQELFLSNYLKHSNFLLLIKNVKNFFASNFIY